MSDKQNYMKTRPFRKGSSQETIFFKIESQHEDKTAEMIITRLTKTGALGKIITNFPEETLLKRSYPDLIPLKLQKAHLLVRKLFSKEKISKVPLTGRFKHFERMWEILTRDQEILEIVTGYIIPMLSKPLQRSVPIKKELHG